MLSITKHFNRRLFLSVLLIAVSQFNYGFDNQAFAQTQAMDAFTEKFGTFNEAKGAYALEAYWLSLFNSTPYVGFAIGLVVGSMVSARWGRRMTMFTMSIYALISATIVITAQTRGHIMAGRILNCVSPEPLSLRHVARVSCVLIRRVKMSTLGWNYPPFPCSRPRSSPARFGV
jgi:MFS family permease